MKLVKKSPRYLISGLYAITPDELNTAELLRKVRLVLQGGARVLQYRNKLDDGELRLVQTNALRKLTKEFGATFIINDDARLAWQVNADGVHLGSGDGSVVEARKLLGGDKKIGVSCYNRLELAHLAVQQGANYVAFGAFFPSSVKPDAPVVTLELLLQARSELNVQIVAIGGIDLQNGRQLIEVGADALAVISAVFGATDIQQATQQFSTLFSERTT